MPNNNIDLLSFDEVKTALLHYANTHSGYTLMHTGNRLFMVHKNEEGVPAETLDIFFKKDTLANTPTMADWLKGVNNNLYPINICYMVKFDALGRGEVSRYNDDNSINKYLRDGSVIGDDGLREIYIELAEETDKGYLLEHGLTSFVNAL